MVAPAAREGKTFSHLMLDLETLGTRPGCAIVSIGAVAFDPNTRELGPQFYTAITRRSCQNAGLFEESGTLAWWSKQSAEAQRVLKAPDAISLRDALDRFTAWAQQFPGKRRVWGCGASFDNAILSHAYAAIQKRAPWQYANERCYRTLKNLVPLVTTERQGTHHNALDDAIHQARHTVAILDRLGSALRREFAA